MYLNNAKKIEEIRTIALQDLRKYGIKFRPKKIRPVQENRVNRRVFKNHLHLLPTERATLTNGLQPPVPKILHEMCSFLLTKVNTKGLFRKGGTKGRENDIQLSLDAGCTLGDDHYEIDVASVLKRFLRELPEPLFPYSYHELFLHCMVLKEDCLKAILLACLLLPAENLNTLAYLMDFFSKVAEHSDVNKMDSFNLAVVIAPTVLPIEQKYASYASSRLEHNRNLIKLLIENSSKIGLISDDIIDRISQTSDPNSLNAEGEDCKKRKKRRSGSFSRILGGLKKMVGGKGSPEENNGQVCVNTPDILITPHITRSSKKRKASESRAFSSKKKCEILHNLPQGSALVATPFTPSRTPISVHPNPQRSSPPPTNKKQAVASLNPNGINGKEKRSQWPLVSRRSKTKQSTESLQRSRSTKNLLERRWSAVSSATGWGRKKTRHSLGEPVPIIELQPIKSETQDEVEAALEEGKMPQQNIESDYIKIPRAEYEEIKYRMSAIEKRLSAEFEAAFVETPEPQAEELVVKLADVAEDVQSAYQKTLEEVGALSSPTTDQLAKRLSRELKIRRSDEFKVIRSPSARKIGSLRRKSKELERSTRLNRNYSVDCTPRTNLRRGQPNTVMSGLPQPSPMVVPTEDMPNRRLTRSSSCYGSYLGKSGSDFGSVNGSGADQWTSAEGFFRTLESPLPNKSFDGRASLAKLRTQNAGMVLAKAKLFDGLNDEEIACTNGTTTNPKAQPRKIGSHRNNENRMRMLRNDDRRASRKSTPRRRQRRLQNANKSGEIMTSPAIAISSCDSNLTKNKENDFLSLPSPKTPASTRMPPIRKQLSVKSPKRILRTPHAADFKGTPLRALANHNNNVTSTPIF